MRIKGVIIVFSIIVYIQVTPSLRQALLHDDSQQVETLLKYLKKTPPLIELYQLYAYYPRFNLSTMTEIFINYQADVYATNQKLYTPLHYAAAKGNSKAIDTLMRIYPRSYHITALNAQDIHKRTPLHYAAEKGHTEVVRVLLQYGADATIKDDNQETALSLAQKSSIPALRRLSRLVLLYSRSTSPLRR